jgi:hypothetical protein
MTETDRDFFQNFETSQDNGQYGRLQECRVDERRVLGVVGKVEPPRHEHDSRERQGIDERKTMGCVIAVLPRSQQF